jgi:hypothetical protein
MYSNLNRRKKKKVSFVLNDPIMSDDQISMKEFSISGDKQYPR